MPKKRTDQEIATELYTKAQKRFSILQEKLRLGKDLTEKERALRNAIKVYGDELTTTKDVYVLKASCTAIYEKLDVKTPWNYDTLSERIKSLARSLYKEYLQKPMQIQLM